MGEVRYCTTDDGVRIAYTVEGSGLPLVITPYFFESITFTDTVPQWEALIDALRPGRQLVRYDMRGTGLSQRDVPPLTHEGLLLDLEAVVRAAVLKRFALLGWVIGSLLAIEYAARHPRSVSRLLLYSAWARNQDVMPADNLRGLAALCRSNWQMASQIFADMSLRQEAPDLGLLIAEQLRTAVSGDAVAYVLEQVELDRTELLPSIKAPTLILHRVNDTAIPFATSQRLAAGIPNARLVPLSGNVNYPAVGDTHAFIDAVNAFLKEDAAQATEPAAPAEAAPGSSVRAVLFTDIVGHTAMMRRLGDAAGRQVLREHERIIRAVLPQHDGTEVKTMGDGFMASFSSVAGAVECAIALQRAFDQRNESASEPVQIRVGLNAGEPIEEGGDLFGETVILAARIASLAEGGEILASLGVRELCAGKGFLFADRGEIVLRGFEDPARLFEVSWRG